MMGFRTLKTKEVMVLENGVTLMGKTYSVYGTVEERSKQQR